MLFLMDEDDDMSVLCNNEIDQVFSGKKLWILNYSIFLEKPPVPDTAHIVHRTEAYLQLGVGGYPPP